MKKAQLLVSALLLVLLLVACAPVAAPAPAPVPQTIALAPAKPVAPIVPAKPAWQLEWEKTVAAAKQEGRVVLYTTLAGEERQAVTGAFSAKYGIPVESVTANPALLPPKFAIERRAGIYSGDIMVGGSSPYRTFPEGILDSIESALILPELTEPELIKKTWFAGELNWGDKARTTLIPLIRPAQPIGINTDLVKPGEIRAYRDLLDPKWRGKMSLNDPQGGGMGEQWFSVVLELKDVDVNFMRELAEKQELFITRDRRLQAEWLARGKHAIALGLQDQVELEFVRAGSPVSRINIGSLTASGGGGSGINLLNRAPHPNAAKVFINWIMSQEGQTVHSRALARQSQRLDVPTTHVEPSLVLRPGVDIFRVDVEEFAMKRVTKYAPLAKEVFGLLTR